MYGKPWAYSNHAICEEAELLLFKHLINTKILTFAFNLFNNTSKCFNRFRSFYIFDSFLFKNVRKIFHAEYSIQNVFNNDIDAVKARILFVQKNEPRSTYYRMQNDQ